MHRAEDTDFDMPRATLAQLPRRTPLSLSWSFA
jgi:hypothetical protein